MRVFFCSLMMWLLVPLGFNNASAAPTQSFCPKTANGQQVDHCENGHPVNAQGDYMDGSPQPSDNHCRGTDIQIGDCENARRPECNNGQEKDPDFAMYCWAPEINNYNWNTTEAFKILYCESRGKENALNPAGPYNGLMQEQEGSYNPVQNIHDAFYIYYQARNNSWYAWSCA